MILTAAAAGCHVTSTRKVDSQRVAAPGPKWVAPAVPKLVAAPAPAPAPGAPSNAGSLCAELEARNSGNLRRLPKLSDDCMRYRHMAPDAPFVCKENPAGAWALVVSLRSEKEFQALALEERPCERSLHSPALELDLVYRARGGEESVYPGFHRYADHWGDNLATLHAAFDFDGDGVLEAVVEEYTEGEGYVSTTFRFLTFRQQAIASYEAAQRWKPLGVSDFDGDGRPDLGYDVHHAITSDNGPVGSETTFGGLAHSLADGTFSSSDAVVADYFRQKCPAPPAAVVALSSSGRDDEATGRNIVCARAWGQDRERIRTVLNQSCATWSDDPKIVVDPQRRPARDPCPSWWLTWLRDSVDHRLR